MTETELKLDQIEDYARMRLDVDAPEVARLIGCADGRAEMLIDVLVAQRRLVRRADAFAIEPARTATMRGAA